MAAHLVSIPRLFQRSFFSIILQTFLLFTSFCQEPLIIRPNVESGRSSWSGLEHTILRRPRIGLVLSGGGARGIAQIGVLKVLERYDIPVDFIAATSLGAVVGGLYAAGYTVAELESIAVTTDWDEVLSLTEDTRRTDLFVEQKMEDDRTFLSLRFEGFAPVLPSAVSSGQRLTNFLNSLTFRAVYQPDESFDDLRVSFRAISTDLVSGKRVVMKRGSLAEALRASTTVPLLFSPVEKDSLRLVDGGLVSNIPVDVAREEGCDLVIAVNTTSGMRSVEDLGAPWQTADQIMGIMMQLSNREQLQLADVRIVPDLGNHLSSDFSGLSEIIRLGECSAEPIVQEFLRTYQRDMVTSEMDTSAFRGFVTVEYEGDWPGDHPTVGPWEDLQRRTRSVSDVRRNLDALFAAGMEGAHARMERGDGWVQVVYVLKENRAIREVRFRGNSLIGSEVLEGVCAPLIGKPPIFRDISASLEQVIRRYRKSGLSLARIEHVSVDSSSGILSVHVTEGVIRKIAIEGAERTRDYVVLREFPMEEGDVFRIDQATKGLESISGTTLFEYVQLDVAYPSGGVELTIRLKERPSQLLSLGLRIDNERNLQGLLELRDDNIDGTGSSAGFSISGGGRNQEFVLDLHVHRLFDSYFSFKTALFLRTFDHALYGNATVTEPGYWEREEIGEYRTQRYGGDLALGTQIEKIGNVHAGLSVQRVQTMNRRDAETVAEQYNLTRMEFGTVIDSKDSYPFPATGIGADISFEFAFEGLGGEVQYNALRAVYESFHTWAGVHTIHPVVTLGFADKTMPFSDQFRLGGLETMYGLREDDSRGRQLLLMNMEYRWQFPFQILFDTYLQLRYDFGNISEVPEEIKFSTFRHGVGAAISLDTPIGPASIAMGKSFYFSDDAAHLLQQGPLLFYFMIGYPLWLPSAAMLQ